MILEENFKSFSSHLPVEEEVFVVEDEEDSGGRGLEVFEVPTFDPDGALAAVVLNAVGVIVDLEVVIHSVSSLRE